MFCPCLDARQTFLTNGFSMFFSREHCIIIHYFHGNVKFILQSFVIVVAFSSAFKMLLSLFIENFNPVTLIPRRVKQAF